uniref:Flagellin n=1 Tax=Romanomermis culicivorax TaxID=13658 RepID=A0A915I9M3_ROMCU
MTQGLGFITIRGTNGTSANSGDDEIIIDYTIPDDADSLSQQMETTTGDNMDYAQLTSAVTTSTALGIQGMTEDIDNEYTTLARQGASNGAFFTGG